MKELNLANVVEEIPQVEVSNDDKPSIKITVKKIDETCNYRFTFEATKGVSNTHDGKVTFTLSEVFGNPQQEGPNDDNGKITFTGHNGTWDYGTLNPGKDTKTKSFIASYIGDITGSIVVLSNLRTEGRNFSEELNPDSEYAEVIKCQQDSPIAPTITAEVSSQGDCRYLFTLTATKAPGAGNNVATGMAKFTVDDAFSDIQTEMTLDSNLNIDNKTWEFGPLEGEEDSKYVTFSALYRGDGSTIVEPIIVNYSGTFANDSDNDAFEGTAYGNEITPSPCPPEQQIHPDVDIDVTRIKGTCEYNFKFTITKGKGEQNNVTDGKIHFKLSDLFTNPVANNPIDGTFNPLEVAPTESIWKYDSLDEDNKSKTASFNAHYVGEEDPSFKVLSGITSTGDIKGKAFEDTKSPVTIGVAQCTHPQTPCCEECDGHESEPINIYPCEQKVVADPVMAEVKPSGRTLFVNLNVPNACKQRDVNVAVYLFERKYSDEEKSTYTDSLYALRVVRLSATCPRDSGEEEGTNSCYGCEPRTCSCLEFNIDDDSTTQCKTRTFIVKTKAHYISSGTSMCPCNCSSASQV